MKHMVTEVALYSLASAVALAVDMGILWLLVEQLNLHYLAAATLSFLAGTLLVYLLSIWFIFGHRRLSDRRFEFAAFAAIGALGLVVNLLVLKAAVDLLGLHYMVAKLCSVAFTFALNFGLRRLLLFTSPLRAGKKLTTGGLAR